jgi:hypothetical protein
LIISVILGAYIISWLNNFNHDIIKHILSGCQVFTIFDNVPSVCARMCECVLWVWVYVYKCVHNTAERQYNIMISPLTCEVISCSKKWANKTLSWKASTFSMTLSTFTGGLGKYSNQC